MADKRLKHQAMAVAGYVNRPLYERMRHVLMRGWWPRLHRPRTISEWLVRKKIENRFDRPSLCGKLEGYRAVEAAGVDLRAPQVLAVLDAQKATLPDDLSQGSYILKGSNGSGMIERFVVTGDGMYDPPREDLNRTVRTWLRQRYDLVSGELLYRHARSCVLVERNVLGANHLAADIKIHCAMGHPRIVQYIDRAQGALRRFTWEVGPDPALRPARYYRGELDVPPPEVSMGQLNKATRLAAQLADGLDYVRIDFMVSDTEIYFAEFTFLPAGGCMPLLDFDRDRAFYDLCFGSGSQHTAHGQEIRA